MSVIKFAEEFTQLLVRWRTTTTSNSDDAGNGITPLSNKQIIKTMQDVLQVIVGANLKIHDYSSVETPASGIAVCTPAAPTIPKISLDPSNVNLSRYRSLDALTTDASQSDNLNLPDSGNASSRSEEEIDMMENDTLDALPGERKFISRSSPAIHSLSAMNRSETFVRENTADETKVGDKSKEEIFDVFENAELDLFSNPEKTVSRSFLQRIDVLRQHALKVVSEVDALKKEAYPQSTNPIRRLSCVGGFPGLPRSSTMMRPAPPKLRRASTAFPGTPTSSKLNTTVTAEKNDTTSKRKHLAPSIPSNVTSKFTACASTKSPLSAGKPKNPKYAHVQSTIPKSAVGKRKAQ